MSQPLLQITKQPNEKLGFDSNRLQASPFKYYHAKTLISGLTGQKYFCYFVMFFFNSDGNEISRRVRWIDDFSGQPKEYEIIAKSPAGTNAVSVGYRANIEGTKQGHLSLKLIDPNQIKIMQIDNEQTKELHDSLYEYDNQSNYVKLEQSLQEFIECHVKDYQKLAYGTPFIKVEPNVMYSTASKVIGIDGEPYSAYFSVIFLDANGKEVSRHIRWINDFSGEQKEYHIVAKARGRSSFAVIGYRCNTEGATSSNIRMKIRNVKFLELRKTADDRESYDEFFDYKVMYSRANLDKDYWTVVGPSSKDLFEQGAIEIFNLLRDQGLKSSSSLLDIGCGTGRLASQLSNFLNNKGLYYGTDLTEQAISYCKKHFRRRNFRFLNNEMTKIPITRKKFDFITFFAVFMHLYPEEISELLRECKRLLKKRGIIIADLFITEDTNDYIGTRTSVAYNKNFIMQLMISAGFQPYTIQENPPDSGRNRTKIYCKLTHSKTELNR